MRDHASKMMDAMAAPALDAAFAQMEAQMEAAPQGFTLWSQFHAQYRMAQVTRDAMRNPEATPVDRDFASVTYALHCDRMMDLLEVMSEQQLLVDIGNMLNRRVR